MTRQSIYMGDHTVLTTLAHGPKIYVNTRDISLAPHIILEGVWEGWVTSVFASLVKPGMTVLDIGANCGYYSLLAAKLVGSNGHVHAFEPNPIHHRNIVNSFAINGFAHAHLHKVAVSECHDSVYLHIPDAYTGSASLHDFDREQYAVSSVTVSTVVLDEYLTDVRPHIAKVDIEGSEPAVIDSLIRLNTPTIFMEYAPLMWNESPRDVLMRFVDAGYRLFEVIQHDATLRHVTVDELVAMNGQCDLLIRR